MGIQFLPFELVVMAVASANDATLPNMGAVGVDDVAFVLETAENKMNQIRVIRLN